jgi:hypothetical protein
MIFSCSMIEPGQPCVTNHWQRIFVLGANVNEMDFDAVDHRGELRQGVEARLDLAPVVVLPVAHQPLSGSQLDALRLVADDFLFRPFRCRQTPSQVDEIMLGHIDAERSDCCIGRGGRRLQRKQSGHAGRDRAHGNDTQQLPAVRVHVLVI